jgi:hypothetical protein
LKSELAIKYDIRAMKVATATALPKPNANTATGSGKGLPKRVVKIRPIAAAPAIQGKQPE